MKNNNIIQIKTKSIIIISAVIFGFIASLFLLNNISERRKYNQFRELNEKTTNAFHLKLLDSLSINFDIHDTISVNKIKEQLRLLSQDINEISTCELLIPNKNGIFKIGSYASEIEVVSFLPKKEEKLIKLLNTNIKKQNNLENEIYKITEGEYTLWTMIKMENCFIIATRFRK